MNENGAKSETKRFPYFKIFLGLLCIVAVILVAMAVEKSISSSVKAVTIEKASVSSSVKFIRVKPLDTRIMAVRASDGSIRLAFDDCLSCYYNEGIRATFTDTGESVVCDNCGCETLYDDMGLLLDECTPIPILAEYVIDDGEKITVPKDFLEQCKDMLDILRSGKGNYATVYDQNDFMNMEITEASDAAVGYDDGREPIAKEPVSLDDLLGRTEDITKLYNGYLNDVTVNASQSDIGAFTACYKEFIVLCDELAETDISDSRSVEISEKFDEIEARLREIGKKSQK